MKQLKLSGKALVIRMDRDEVRVARMNIGKADPQILESAVMPTPEGAMIDGMIENQFQMEEVLNEITSRPEFKRTKKVVFSLCTSQVITETVTVPAVGDKKMAKMLEANMDMYFPVEISDRHIVWHVIRRNNEAKEVTVQLWAIPTQMLAGYYALANACGLSVAAIDYCGNSMVNAVGALFADDTAASTGLQPQTFFGIQIGGKKKEKPKKEKKAKKEKKPLFKKKQTEPELTAEDLTKEEPVFDGLYGEEAEALRKEEAASSAEAVNEVDTDIYLMLENEHLIVTFVQEGNVKMQRVLLCGYNIENELDEIQMMIEYFSTTEHASFGQFRVILCGKLSGDPVLVGKVESVLDLPVHTFDFQKGPGWCLCFGAAQSGLDYGIAALNQFKGPSKKVAAQWQWGVLALAGLLLVLSVVSFMGSRTIWKTTITSLEDQERILRIQEAANAGYADRFYQYQYEYSSYSNDWDVLHKSIRTYNDNLSKMLKEVERTLPKNTDVVTIGIANEGLGLQFACPDKETAAYIIIALRKLEYATLDGISNLTVGPGTSAQDMLPSLKAKTEATLGTGTTTVPEQAPTEGSGIDQAQLLQIMMQAQKDSGSTDYNEILQQAIKSGAITEKDLEEALNNLTPDQKAQLEEAYGNGTSTTTYKLDDLLKRATLHQRKEAIERLMTKDPVGVYRFALAFEEDMKRPQGEDILYSVILDDLWKNPDLMAAMFTKDVKEMEKHLPELVDILTKNEKSVKATENLIKTDKTLSERYAYHLAVEMDLQKKPSGEGTIDTEELWEDLKNGKVDMEDDVIQSIVGGAILGSGSTDNNDDLKNLYEQIMGGGSGSGSGLSGEMAEQDTRIHFAVALGYKPELIEEEQIRKGLNSGVKVQPLEVE